MGEKWITKFHLQIKKIKNMYSNLENIISSTNKINVTELLIIYTSFISKKAAKKNVIRDNQ